MFATSAFENHSLTASIQTAQSTIDHRSSESHDILFITKSPTTKYVALVAVGKHVIAKPFDVTSGPFAYVVTNVFASELYLMALCPANHLLSTFS